MENLQVINHKNQRVLTTQQLAEQYGTESQVITNNFNRNKERYQIGVHYFTLEGDDKRAFINSNQIDLGSKKAQMLYLWTEKGCLLHAKSLGTDKAWEVYGMLVDTYFRFKEIQAPQFAVPKTFSEALRLAADLQDKLDIAIPKAEKRDRLIEAENCKPIGDIAKVLGQGRNKFFAKLREDKILDKNNVPYQQYINSGYFKVKVTPVTIGFSIHNQTTTFVTAKGIDWLDNKYKLDSRNLKLIKQI